MQEESKFYVYHGYCSPDNYDSSEGPTYGIKEAGSIEEVDAFRLEFFENIHDECFNVLFRIFKGQEVSLCQPD